jgi:hypothetical protein
MSPEDKSQKIFNLRQQTNEMLNKNRKPLPEGCFESVQVLMKEAFPDLTTGPGDMDYWENIEKRANLKPNEACFQYYLKSVDHKKLARMILLSVPNIVPSLNLGSADPELVNNYIDALGATIFKYYPPRYREKYQREMDFRQESDKKGSRIPLSDEDQSD